MAHLQATADGCWEARLNFFFLENGTCIEMADQGEVIVVNTAALCSSEMLVFTDKSTWHHNPEYKKSSLVDITDNITYQTWMLEIRNSVCYMTPPPPKKMVYIGKSMLLATLNMSFYKYSTLLALLLLLFFTSFQLLPSELLRF